MSDYSVHRYEITPDSTWTIDNLHPVEVLADALGYLLAVCIHHDIFYIVALLQAKYGPVAERFAAKRAQVLVGYPFAVPLHRNECRDLFFLFHIRSLTALNNRYIYCRDEPQADFFGLA